MTIRCVVLMLLNITWCALTVCCWRENQESQVNKFHATVGQQWRPQSSCARCVAVHLITDHHYWHIRLTSMAVQKIGVGVHLLSSSWKEAVHCNGLTIRTDAKLYKQATQMLQVSNFSDFCNFCDNFTDNFMNEGTVFTLKENDECLTSTSWSTWVEERDCALSLLQFNSKWGQSFCNLILFQFNFLTAV